MNTVRQRPGGGRDDTRRAFGAQMNGSLLHPASLLSLL